jgi:hypothetical protein
MKSGMELAFLHMYDDWEGLFLILENNSKILVMQNSSRVAPLTYTVNQILKYKKYIKCKLVSIMQVH